MTALGQAAPNEMFEPSGKEGIAEANGLIYFETFETYNHTEISCMRTIV